MLINYRIRGYQTKSQGKGEPQAYRSLNNQREQLAEARMPSSKADAVDLEQVGFAKMFESQEQ